MMDSMEQVRAKMLSREVKKCAMKTAKTPIKAAKTAVKTAKTPTKAADVVWKHKPIIGFEKSRKQVMCRSGKCGAGSTYAIKFAGNGGEKVAWKKAEEWLAAAREEYKKAGHVL